MVLYKLLFFFIIVFIFIDIININYLSNIYVDIFIYTIEFWY